MELNIITASLLFAASFWADEVSLPYFNSMDQNGRVGGDIVGKDDARWNAAVKAAKKLPLHKTSSNEVEKIFGYPIRWYDKPNRDWILYIYCYGKHELPKNTPKHHYYALIFTFNPKRELENVVVKIHYFPPVPDYIKERYSKNSEKSK